MDIDALKARFEAVYGRRPVGGVQAPGRVNLIGEHTDYNDGYVLPIAIDRRTVALFAPRDDCVVNLASLQQEAKAAIDLSRSITPGELAWANYPRGVAAGLAARGVKLVGADIMFDSDVPIGGGLSSSASLEVATATALLAAAGALDTVPDGELARLCQKAEHDFAGAPCGIMDQSIAIMAEADKALLLDCRSGQARQIRFDDPRVVLLVADTRVRHDLADGAYAERRQQCESAARKLSLDALRDADESIIEQARSDGTLSQKEFMRARHVVTEIGRTLRAVEALEAGRMSEFGRLMYASHASLRDDFEVSCEELDAVVDLARGCGGVYGARMTGGGFGGCAIVLAEADRADAIRETIAAGFADKFSRRCGVFATRACAGAGVLE